MDYSSTDTRTVGDGIFLGTGRCWRLLPYSLYSARHLHHQPLEWLHSNISSPRAPKRPHTSPMPFPCHDELDTFPIIPRQRMPDLDTEPSILCSLVLSTDPSRLVLNPNTCILQIPRYCTFADPFVCAVPFQPMPEREKKRLQCCPDLPNAMTGPQTDPVHTPCPALSCPVHCKHPNSHPKPSKHPKLPSPAPLGLGP